MIWHPLILAVFVLHLAGLALLAGASLRAVRLVIGWEPASASAKQLSLERAAEGASVQAAASFAAFLAGALVLVGAIATALPTLVPGAMCGTGVLEAMQGLGGRALAMQGLALGAFVVWRELDRLDRSRPEAPLATASARALLVTLPAQAVASWMTLQALLSLDTHRPVDCCSVVYAGVRGGAADATHARPSLVWLAGLGALVVVALALVVRRRPGSRGAVLLFAAASVAWLAPATLALVRVLAAYRYEVLSHECPWCLFLAEHRFAGYGLFGALGVVALEALAALVASRASVAAPATAEAATRRVRAAGLRVAAATVVFALLAAWPALSWYARFGVWMHG